MTLPLAGPRRVTSEVSGRTDEPTDLRVGTVTAVTSRGVTVNCAGGEVPDVAHLGSYQPGIGDTVVLQRWSNSWIVFGRPIGPGTPTDNATPGLSLGLPLIDGMVLTMAGGAMAASTGALVNVPRYGVTFYHPVNHWVLLLTAYTWFCSVSGDVIQVTWYDTISGTVIGKAEHVQQPNASFFPTTGMVAPASLGGARRSYAMKIQRISGTGTNQIEDHATRRGFMLALDMGDAGIIRTV